MAACGAVMAVLCLLIAGPAAAHGPALAGVPAGRPGGQRTGPSPGRRA